MKIGRSFVKVLGITLILCLALWSCSRQDPPPEKSESKGLSKTTTEPKKSGSPKGEDTTSSFSRRVNPPEEPEVARSRSVQIEGVTLEPGSPVTGDYLKAVVVASSGGENGKPFSYCWKVNGQTVQESPSEVLNSSIKRGDFVEVEVRSGGSDGPGNLVSRCATVCNAPPDLSLSGQKMGEDGQYEARVEATDPERDTVSFSLKSGPPGMSVDSKTGKIFWAMGAEGQGTFSVQVAAKDVEGAEAVLSYQIKVRRESGGRN